MLNALHLWMKIKVIMHGTFAQKQRYVNGLYYVLASSAACVDKNTVKVSCCQLFDGQTMDFIIQG